MAWLLVISVATPSAMTLFLGGVKFTPARAIITCLLVPALFELFRKDRLRGGADLFAVVASVLMVCVTLQTDPQSWSSALALVLEFTGSYFVARAYIYGPLALRSFTQALKPIAAVVIGLAFLEHVAGSLITHNTIAAIWGLPPANSPEFRYGVMRASATFPHPILYGTFCAIAGAIFLYSERGVNRILFVGLAFFGCVLSMSSAPLMSFFIAIGVCIYDVMLRRFSWRWRAMGLSLTAMLIVIYCATNKPISWVVAHLTLDPATGYFRVATWDVAFHYIGLSPYVGYGFEAFADRDDFFGNASVDSVWLTMALRFGIPFIILVFVMNVLAFRRSGPTVGPRKNGLRKDSHDYMYTGFTLVVILFMFTGLTVHYWNNIWMFWGICIGIRASLREEFLKRQAVSATARRCNGGAGDARQAASPSQIAGYRM